jgi:hypothetical protein
MRGVSSTAIGGAGGGAPRCAAARPAAVAATELGVSHDAGGEGAACGASRRSERSVLRVRASVFFKYIVIQTKLILYYKDAIYNNSDSKCAHEFPRGAIAHKTHGEKCWGRRPTARR